MSKMRTRPSSILRANLARSDHVLSLVWQRPWPVQVLIATPTDSLCHRRQILNYDVDRGRWTACAKLYGMRFIGILVLLGVVAGCGRADTYNVKFSLHLIGNSSPQVLSGVYDYKLPHRAEIFRDFDSPRIFTDRVGEAIVIQSGPDGVLLAT